VALQNRNTLRHAKGSQGLDITNRPRNRSDALTNKRTSEEVLLNLVEVSGIEPVFCEERSPAAKTKDSKRKEDVVTTVFPIPLTSTETTKGLPKKSF
jgi:hypothetical protein